MCAFAEAAVTVGHRVCIEQVINIEGLTNSGSGFLSVTKIKDYDAPLNPSSMAAIGCCTASLRLTDFGHCTQVPEAIVGYGSPRPITIPRLAARGVIDENAHTLLIPQTMRSKEEALLWIKQAVEDLEKRVNSGEWTEPSDHGFLAVWFRHKSRSGRKLESGVGYGSPRSGERREVYSPLPTALTGAMLQKGT